jgi:DNA polymerase-4
LTIVPQDKAESWLAPLPVTRLWGVGKKTAPKFYALGLNTIGDVARADKHFLKQHLGPAGLHFLDLAHARDPRKVLRGRTSQSIGSDRTLRKDVSKREEIEMHLRRAADRIARRVRAKNYVAAGIRVRLKSTKHELMTRQRKLPKPSDTAETFLEIGKRLLDEFDHPGPFRLVGMAAFDLVERGEPQQLDLFEDHTRRDLETTIDHLIGRFGKDVVVRAADLDHSGTVAANGVNLDFLDHQSDDGAD